MICDNTDGYIRVIIFLIFHARNFTHGCAQRKHRVHIENGVHILHHGGQSLQPHAGVDVLLLKLRVIALAVVVKLGEHVIPDFHVAVAVAAYRTAGLATAIPFTPVIINFRAGTTRTGTVLPEIVFLAKTENPLRGNAHLPAPDIESFIIVLIDGRIQPVRRQPNYPGQKLPAPGNGLPLKIIPEREVAKHLKKSAVSCSLSHVLQIPGTNALLAGRDAPFGRNLLSRKIGLERRHAGINQKQAVVVVGHQRKAFHLQMPLALKKVKKHPAQFIYTICFHRSLILLSHFES